MFYYKWHPYLSGTNSFDIIFPCWLFSFPLIFSDPLSPPGVLPEPLVSGGAAAEGQPAAGAQEAAGGRAALQGGHANCAPQVRALRGGYNT